MLGAIKNLFTSEKCAMCGEVTREGVTGFDNKFRCYTCKRVDDERNLNPIKTVVEQPKPVEIQVSSIYAQDPTLSKSQKEAYSFFSNIYGLEKYKEAVYLTITAPEPVHRLLAGPPAGGKSLFGLTILKKMKDVIFFDAANTSGAGLIDTLSNNRNAKILVIDEISALTRRDLECLKGLTANGIVVKTLKGKRISFEMPGLHIIATTNSTAKCDKAIMSRFLISVIPEYSDDEFVKVLEFCLKDRLPVQTTHMIAAAMLEDKRKDVRKAMAISALIREYHTFEDVKRIVSIELENDNNEQVVDFL